MIIPRHHFYLIIALLLITSCFYWPTLKGGFVYDEVESVLRNDALFKAPLTDALFSKEYFSLSREVTYRPVVTLSYFIDHALWGMAPWGWRLTNLLCHLLTVVLLYAFIHAGFGNRFAAFLSALLFALHPMHVEAVAGVGFREDLLAASSLLVLVLAYQLWAGRSIPGRAAYIIAGVAAMIGQLSKENAFVAPVLIAALALVGWGLPHAATPIHRKRVLFMGIVAGATIMACFVRFFLMRNSAVPPTPPLGGSYLAMWARAPWIWFEHGLLPILVPFHLRPDRIVDPASIGLFRIVAGWLIAGLSIVFLIWTLKRHRSKSFGHIWYVVLWLPTMNLVPLMVPAAERYAYAPNLGLAMLLGGVLSSSRRAAYVVLPTACLIAGLLTYRQVNRWETIETLWDYQLRVDARSIRARHSLSYEAWQKSQAAYKQGDVQLGHAYMQRSLNMSREAYRLAPDDKDALTNYAIFLYYSGQSTEAERIFNRILQRLPNDRVANEMLKKIQER